LPHATFLDTGSVTPSAGVARPAAASVATPDVPVDRDPVDRAAGAADRLDRLDRLDREARTPLDREARTPLDREARTPLHPLDREALVRDNRALAERLALRFAGRGQPTEDLRQVAYLGLVLAARRYDPEREVAFTTFAYATVLGELKRHFRDHAWQLHVSRPVQEAYAAVRAAAEDLTHRRGRTPTTAELAAAAGVTEEQVIESLEARSALRTESLDVTRAEDDPRPVYDRPTVEAGFRTVEERSWLVPALGALPERERRILKLRFFDGLPQSAIAAEVGISQMHVSRLLARSLTALRAAANA